MAGQALQEEDLCLAELRPTQHHPPQLQDCLSAERTHPQTPHLHYSAVMRTLDRARLKATNLVVFLVEQREEALAHLQHQLESLNKQATSSARAVRLVPMVDCSQTSQIQLLRLSLYLAAHPQAAEDFSERSRTELLHNSRVQSAPHNLLRAAVVVFSAVTRLPLLERAQVQACSAHLLRQLQHLQRLQRHKAGYSAGRRTHPNQACLEQRLARHQHLLRLAGRTRTRRIRLELRPRQHRPTA